MLSTHLSYFLTPIIYHSPVGGSSAYYCSLLIEFVDTHTTFILLTLFLVTLLAIKNKGLGPVSLEVVRTEDKLKISLISPRYTYLNSLGVVYRGLGLTKDSR